MFNGESITRLLINTTLLLAIIASISRREPLHPAHATLLPKRVKGYRMFSCSRKIVK